MASCNSIAKVAEKFGLSYQETRAILKERGVKMRRGRKRGSGSGLELSANSRTDRRVSWLAKMIEEMRCTSCGKPNDSDSLYHCNACLRDRNKQAKKRNEEKKSRKFGGK